MLCYCSSTNGGTSPFLTYLIIEMHLYLTSFIAIQYMPFDLIKCKIITSFTLTDLSETGVDALLVFPLSVPPSPLLLVLVLPWSFFVTD